MGEECAISAQPNGVCKAVPEDAFPEHVFPRRLWPSMKEQACKVHCYSTHLQCCRFCLHSAQVFISETAAAWARVRKARAGSLKDQLRRTCEQVA